MECQFPGADVFLSVLLTAKFPGAYLLHEGGAPHVVPEKECVWLLTKRTSVLIMSQKLLW